MTNEVRSFGDDSKTSRQNWKALKTSFRCTSAIKHTAKSGLVLPEPLNNAELQGTFTLEDVPTPQALSAWLEARGIDTSAWGAGNTKSVAKYWKELDGQEAGLELWKKANGELQPVRVTHVLRAKVCSPSSYESGVFLFNTWQQYGDGRKRTRNGLLSEKLTLDEMPLEKFMHEVCERAVTEEEMQRVEDAVCTISADRAAPEYDPDYQCPLTVVDETFVDHTVEVEISKSYPGLLTLYHLYTVDILVEGLPVVDFNTLEFEHAEPDGPPPKLKYIHAWVWLEWSQIQRYLFEGSSLKERKTKGSFADAHELHKWLGQFNLHLEMWGTETYRSIADLYTELEEENTQLELWGRHDGVPLLMRVVHVIQLKIASNDNRLHDRFLFQVWQQSKSGQVRSVNRLVSKKLQTSQLPFDKERFAHVAREAIHEQLSHFVDSSFQLSPDKDASRMEYQDSEIDVLGVVFQGSHFDLEESPTYKGMHTMYHLYTMEVECEGLPLADFTTVDFKRIGGPYVKGWRWVNWQQSLDIVHGRTQALERQDALRKKHLKELSGSILPRLTELSENMTAKMTAEDNFGEDDEPREMSQLIKKMKEEISQAVGGDKQAAVSLAKSLPPAMVSKLAESAAVPEDLFDTHQESPCLKQSETGQKTLISHRSVTFNRRHSALNDPNLDKFRAQLADNVAGRGDDDGIYRRGSGVLPVVNRSSFSGASSPHRRHSAGKSGTDSPRCARRGSQKTKYDAHRYQSAGSDPGGIGIGIEVGTPIRTSISELRTGMPGQEDCQSLGQQETGNQSKPKSVHRVSLSQEVIVRSLSLPAHKARDDSPHSVTSTSSRRHSVSSINRDVYDSNHSVYSTDTRASKEDARKGIAFADRQVQDILSGSKIIEDSKKSSLVEDPSDSNADVHVPSKMVAAAKAAFLESGIETSGLVDRDVLERIIGQICGNEPEYAANVQMLLDMVCPQDPQGKVSCSAFIDYVFAD